MARTSVLIALGLALLPASAMAEPGPTAFHGSPTWRYAPVLGQALFQDGGTEAAAQAEHERRQLLKRQTALLVESYLANARQLEEQLRFDEAVHVMSRAREIDPTNALVLDYLRQLQALSGQSSAQAELVRMTASDRYKAQRQQMKVLARLDLGSAREALSAGDYDKAVDLARGVSNRIAWSQGDIDWGDLTGQASEVLAEAKALQAGADAAERESRRRQAYQALANEQAQTLRQQELLINHKLISATAAFDRADYEAAQDFAKSVLEIDQHNARALEILDASEDAAREYADRIFIQNRREQFNRWRNEMEKVRIPYADISIDPDPAHWARISEMRGSWNSLGIGAIDPEITKLNEKLDTTRMDANFDEKTIVEVANTLSYSYDVPISVDPEVAQDLDDNAVFVNITGLRDITVKSFLNILVEQLGAELAWTFRNGRVYITLAEKAAGNPVTRVHQIQDLTFGLTDFKGTRISEIALPGEAGDDNESTIFNSELDRKNIITPEEVLNLIRENIATNDAENWDQFDSYTLDLFENNNLLVIHTPKVQAEVAQFLDDLRAFSTSMVTLESRFFAISDLFIEEIGTDLRGLDPTGAFADQYSLDAANNTGNITQGLDNLGDGDSDATAGAFYSDTDQIYSLHSENFFGDPLGSLISTVGGGAFEFSIFDDTSINLVLNLVSKSENATEITAPTVSVYNNQRAFVTVVNQVSFVQDFEVDVATNAFIADPVIGIAQEGIVLDVRPTISYDRRYVTLDVLSTVAELERPFPTITTLLGPNGSPVTFQIPTLQVQEAQTTVVVPDGGAVILGGFKYVRYKNRTAESPWFADIPVLGFFFREKGLADEVTDLIIVIRAKITDFSHLRKQQVAKR